ncbi:unnamed protein product, partial [Chrysoparadoxa australica]
RLFVLGLAFLLLSCGPKYLPAGDAVRMPELTEDHLLLRDGAAVPVARWPAGGVPQGVIIGLHSFGDFRLAFTDIAQPLTAAGFFVVAFDQRGFGGNTDHGRWAGADSLIADLGDAVAAVRKDHPGLPIFVLGESMGGGVALAAAGAGYLEDVDGLILAAPAVREDVTFRYAYNAFLWMASRLAPSYQVYNDRGASVHTPVAQERLSSDPRIVRDVRIDTYWGLIQLADRASDMAPEITHPVLLLHGGADRVVARKSIRALAGHLGDLAEAVYWEDAPHEVLQWREQERVASRVTGWLGNRLR